MPSDQLVYYFQKEIHEASVFAKSKVKHEDAVIFYGYSFSGKSSIINYIIDNELIGTRIWNGTVCIESLNNSSGPKIRFIEKKIPTRWENSKKLPGLALWNTPGFKDYHKIQNIIGSYYTQLIFKNVQSAKIILVIDVNHVTNNQINLCVDLLQSVENWFNGKMREFFDCIAVIFTKVPDKILDNSANKESIIRLLHQKLLSCSDIKISKTILEFVEYLTQNQGNIGLFKQAKLGPITDEIEVDIIDCIKNVKSIDEQTLKLVKPDIMDRSKIFLYYFHHKLFSIKKFNSFQKYVDDIFDVDVQKYLKFNKNDGSKETLLTMKCELIAQLDQLKRVTDLKYTSYERIDHLRIVIPEVENKFDVDELMEMLRFMEFIDDVLNLKENQMFNMSLLCILFKVMSKFHKILVSIKYLLREVDREEFEEHIKRIDLQLKKEIEMLEKELLETKKQYKTQEEESESHSFFLRMLIMVIIAFLFYQYKFLFYEILENDVTALQEIDNTEEIYWD